MTPPPDVPDDAERGFRPFLGVFRYGRRAIDLVWSTSRRLSVALALLTLAAGLLPAAAAWVGKLIVDAVVEAARTGAAADVRAALGFLVLEGAVVAALAGAQRGIAVCRTFSLLLAGISFVSLLVGGIGIMNIMLVSVTERTREIGVRKALGARRRDILLQFLVEALAICLAGGLVGVALGLAAGAALRRFAGWQAFFAPEAILAAFAFAAAVGLFFGIWPARRAARLDPIAALRYE